MDEPIQGQPIIIVEEGKPVPIRGVQVGANGNPLFRVEIARLVRETQVIVVEAPSEEYLQDHLSLVYEKHDEENPAALWSPDLEWLDIGAIQGTHQLMGFVSDAGVAEEADVVLTGNEDDF